MGMALNRSFERQKLSLNYKGHALDCGYRLDILVDNQIVLELKSVNVRTHSQSPTFNLSKLSGFPMGLLLNFNVPLMRDGIVRLVNQLKE